MCYTVLSNARKKSKKTMGIKIYLKNIIGKFFTFSKAELVKESKKIDISENS